ncbi:ribonuclease P 40kDa subunit-domain-containing protein [Phycomyces nitens]|nr:ribonuclease P 40kDa subunit-domain-containing protein [Phycomyces nitens]
MSRKTYLPDLPDLDSAADLAYVDLDTNLLPIDTHPFNNQVAVFLPSCSLEKAQAHLNQDLGWFYQIDIKLSALLDPTFLKTYVQSGDKSLVLHSIDTHLDSDDVIVMDLNGTLVMNLTKSTHEIFGIQARKQTRADKKRQRYVVSINLADPKLMPGSKMYERLLLCLESAFKNSVKMLAASVDKVTGSTLDIEWPAGVIYKRLENSTHIEDLSGITIPSFDNLRPAACTSEKIWEQKAVDAVEWLGLVHLKAKRLFSNDKPDPFVSIYRAPVPNAVHQQGVLVSWKGFILPSLINSLLSALRKLMSAKVTESWTSLSVWGFHDSPFGWDNMQHYYFVGGENDYTLLLLPKSDEEDSQKMAISYKMYGTHHVIQ